MNRPNTKPGVGSHEQPDYTPAVSEGAGVVVTPGPQPARYATDPRLALRPDAEQALVKGLVPFKPEAAASNLPPVEAFASAARAEAKLLGLKRNGASADPSGEQAKATGASEKVPSESESDALTRTTPLAPKKRKLGSTTVGLRAASKDLTKFAAIAVGLALGAYALIWWWVHRTPGEVAASVAPSVASSASSASTASGASTASALPPAFPSVVVPPPLTASAAVPAPSVPSTSVRLPHGPAHGSTAAPPPTPIPTPIVPSPRPSATGEEDPLHLKGM